MRRCSPRPSRSPCSTLYPIWKQSTTPTSACPRSCSGCDLPEDKPSGISIQAIILSTIPIPIPILITAKMQLHSASAYFHTSSILSQICPLASWQSLEALQFVFKCLDEHCANLNRCYSIKYRETVKVSVWRDSNYLAMHPIPVDVLETQHLSPEWRISIRSMTSPSNLRPAQDTKAVCSLPYTLRLSHQELGGLLSTNQPSIASQVIVELPTLTIYSFLGCPSSGLALARSPARRALIDQGCSLGFSSSQRCIA